MCAYQRHYQELYDRIDTVNCMPWHREARPKLSAEEQARNRLGKAIDVICAEDTALDEVLLEYKGMKITLRDLEFDKYDDYYQYEHWSESRCNFDGSVDYGYRTVTTRGGKVVDWGRVRYDTRVYSDGSSHPLKEPKKIDFAKYFEDLDLGDNDQLNPDIFLDLNAA